ncbi:MAG: hypothetical protein LBR29_07395 [Methylobacteriaceae bacterium]|nr:hypothetical protein [Methylobacteriaceae bacterium]
MKRDGNDLIIDIGNGLDQLTIVDGFGAAKVEEFHFERAVTTI